MALWYNLQRLSINFLEEIFGKNGFYQDLFDLFTIEEVAEESN